MKLVKFSATTCNPCNILSMMLNDMGVEPDESYLLDTPEERQAADENYDVLSTPTLLLIDDEGKEVERVVGINPREIMAVAQAAGKM